MTCRRPSPQARQNRLADQIKSHITEAFQFQIVLPASWFDGQSAVVKTRWGMERGEQLLIPGAPKFVKFALGENVTRKGNPDIVKELDRITKSIRKVDGVLGVARPGSNKDSDKDLDRSTMV